MLVISWILNIFQKSGSYVKLRLSVIHPRRENTVPVIIKQHNSCAISQSWKFPAPKILIFMLFSLKRVGTRPLKKEVPEHLVSYGFYYVFECFWCAFENIPLHYFSDSSASREGIFKIPDAACRKIHDLYIFGALIDQTFASIPRIIPWLGRRTFLIKKCVSQVFWDLLL